MVLKKDSLVFKIKLLNTKRLNASVFNSISITYFSMVSNKKYTSYVKQTIFFTFVLFKLSNIEI